MHREQLRTAPAGWALIFLLSALPLIPGPVWAQTAPGVVRIVTHQDVPLGGTAELAVVFEDTGPPLPVSGFSLLIAYDSAYGSLISVAPGDLPVDGDWEYFSYEAWTDSSRGTLPGLCFIRITGRGGDNHRPSPPLSAGANELARLTFDVGEETLVPSAGHGPRLASGGQGDNMVVTAANDTVAVTAVAEEDRNTAAAEEWKASVRVVTPPYLQPGDTAVIRLVLDGLAAGFETGGFNLFLQYDSSAMTVVSVEQGQVLTDCAWETFGWRHGDPGDCNGGPCEKPTIHITGIADNFEPGQPLCWALAKGELARITVVMSADPAKVASAFPIEWVWYACTDNEWASKNGDSVYVSRSVFDHTGEEVTAEAAFPTTTGASLACLPTPSLTRSIDYRHGLVDIISTDSLDYRGDVNYNGAAYEIADWVLFVNVFAYGPGVLTVDPSAQIAATDVNADDIPLTLDDLIYLMRVIKGDALPFPRLPGAGDTLVIEQNLVTRTVSFSWPGQLRGLFLKFDDSVGASFSRTFASAGAGVLDDSTRVLITPSFDFMESFGAGSVLAYSGNANLVYAEASYDGQSTIPVAIRQAVGPVKVQLTPEVFSVVQVDSMVTIPAVLYIGDMVGCTPGEIDPATVRINDTIPGQSWSVAPAPPGFSGEVLAVTIDAWGLIASLSPSWGTDTVGFAVNWLAGPTCPQGGSGSIVVVGYQLGDVDADGTVNVADLTLLVTYLFGNGASRISAEAADINESGSANVRDLVVLVDLLFH